MPNNDQFRIEDLRHRLVKLSREWLGIHDICTKSQSSIDKSIAEEHAAIGRSYVPSLTRNVVSFLAESDSSFANWAAEVVDAFGIEAFPYYLSEPPVLAVLDAERRNDRQQRLTGVDDVNQAGLRIIMWCAATVKPALVLPADSEWFQQVNYRNSVKAWASNCAIVKGLKATADPKILEWVGKAFEELAKPCSLQQRDETAYWPAWKIRDKYSNLFPSNQSLKKFLNKNQGVKFFHKGPKLFIHFLDLFKVLDNKNATDPKKAEEADEPDESVERRKQEVQKKKKQGGL